MSPTQANQDAYLLFDALSRAIDAGIMLIDADAGLKYSTALARELLGCPDAVELREQWPEFRGHLGLSRLGHDDVPNSWISRLPINGRVHTLRLELHPLRMGHGHLVLIRDGRAEEFLDSELQLASLMRAQSQLYGALAHDVRAPLNALHLTLELLTDSLADREPGLSESRRYCAVLKEEIARLNRSLRAVFEQNMPRMHGSIEEFDLRALVDEIVTMLTTQAMRHRVEIVYHPTERELRVLACRDRLKQALISVLLNRLESLIGDGGRLNIEIRSDSTSLTISIRSEGRGIDARMLDEMFQAGVHSPKSAGGMDLFLALRALEAQGGVLHVLDRDGPETSFELNLPRARVSISAFRA